MSKWQPAPYDRPRLTRISRHQPRGEAAAQHGVHHRRAGSDRGGRAARPRAPIAHLHLRLLRLVDDHHLARFAGGPPSSAATEPRRAPRSSRRSTLSTATSAASSVHVADEEELAQRRREPLVKGDQVVAGERAHVRRLAAHARARRGARPNSARNSARSASAPGSSSSLEICASERRRDSSTSARGEVGLEHQSARTRSSIGARCFAGVPSTTHQQVLARAAAHDGADELDRLGRAASRRPAGGAAAHQAGGEVGDAVAIRRGRRRCRRDRRAAPPPAAAAPAAPPSPSARWAARRCAARAPAAASARPPRASPAPRGAPGCPLRRRAPRGRPLGARLLARGAHAASAWASGTSVTTERRDGDRYVAAASLHLLDGDRLVAAGEREPVAPVSRASPRRCPSACARPLLVASSRSRCAARLFFAFSSSLLGDAVLRQALRSSA